MKLQSFLPSLALATLLVLLLAAPAAVQAGGLVNQQVSGSTYTAKVRLPGGLGADLTISFENAVGLSVQDLGVSANLLSVGDLLSLQSRLPSTLTSVPSAFPVLLTIEPPSTGGLSFSGIATVEIYTHDLLYVPGSPLRLFSAPLGGQFVDITASTSAGSYRVRGHKGQFSELLILADLRPISTVIGEKFSALDGDLATFGPSIDPVVLANLQSLLDDAETAWNGGQTVTAISDVEDFAAAVEAASGSDIPDVWRSARDLVNAAGILRAEAETLRYSLILESNGAS